MPLPIPAEVGAAFGLGGASARRYGSGHIHATYRVDAPSGRLIVQRINTTVFRDPERLCANGARIAAHLQRRSPGFVPQPVVSVSGELLVTDAQGQPWRALTWIEHARSYDRVADVSVAREAGRAFGRWHRLLAGCALDITPSIPGFMDLSGRVQELSRAVAGASEGRKQAAQELLDLVAMLRGGLAVAPPGRARVLHADCKINNVLFDADGRAVAVVDLDTVMAGPVALDFGDLARSACATMAEDEADPRRVGFDRSWFVALASGFLAEAGAVLEAEEVATLAAGPAHMAFMLGVRFLSDHLRGDRYFPVQRPGQNLDRARAQLHLARSFNVAREELVELIESSAKG